jgi:hypothetical protein
LHTLADESARRISTPVTILAQTMCSLVPSVTLYGTTQVTTTALQTTTSLSSYDKPSQILITSIGMKCPSNGEPCIPATTTETTTITHLMTSTILKSYMAETVLTQVIPQRTLYRPCPTGDGDNAVAGISGQPREAAGVSHPAGSSFQSIQRSSDISVGGQ